jgi:hypothetical protein
MKLPQKITKDNYPTVCKEFLAFINTLQNDNKSDTNSTLHTFCNVLQQSFPDNLKNLNHADVFFTGEMTKQFVSWYIPLIEIWKEYQELNLPFSKNLIDPNHKQKLHSLLNKLKQIKIA